MEVLAVVSGLVSNGVNLVIVAGLVFFLFSLSVSFAKRTLNRSNSNDE